MLSAKLDDLDQKTVENKNTFWPVKSFNGD
jgi:hypothetical protein